MHLYLDTEFDGFGGPLLSLALACENGHHFYGVIDREATHPWVTAHVVPKFGAAPEPYHDFQARLFHYLRQFHSPTIIADWPEDFAHLCQAMCLPGGRSLRPNGVPRMELVNYADGEVVPEVPHNALSDAVALMRWHLQTPPPREAAVTAHPRPQSQ